MKKILLWVECRLYGLIILIVGLAMTPFVFAQETLDYTGMAISGDVVLANALVNGTQGVTPTSFSFGSINQTNDPGASFQFTVQNGAITAWSLQVSDDLALGNTNIGQSLISTQLGDTYNTYLQAPPCAIVPQWGCYVETMTSSAGYWTDPPSVQKVTAPELDWTRMAEALTLLCGAALVINTRKSH